MMVIVHGALARDLGRARSALATDPTVGDRRTPLAAQLQWMMTFLHHHHVSEDVGLYPLVKERNPSAASLMESMEAEHQAIGPGMAAIEGEALLFARDDGPEQRARLVAAIDLLQASLIPHLEHEEGEFLPLVLSSISQEEWRQWDQRHNIRPKSLLDLGFTTQWLLDSATPEDRQYVASRIPAFARALLLHGFAGSYRRHSSRCWNLQ